MRMVTMIVAAAMALVAGPGGAQPAAPEDGLVVRGEGKVEAAPDMATLTLGVRSRAGTAEEAMARNSEAMTRVLGRLDEAGLAAEDVQTSSVTLSPRRSEPESGEPAQVSGYTAGNMVTVKVRELSRLGTVLDMAIGEGANAIHGLRFDVAESGPLEERARRRAVSDAVEKAEQFAEAAGIALGPVRAIHEEAGGGGPVMMAESRMADAVPIAEGRVTFEQTVRMVFSLDPGADSE